MKEGNSIYKKHFRSRDLIAITIINVFSFLSILLLAGIVGYLTYRGASSLNWSFLTTVSSSIRGSFGIAGNLVNTLYIIIITLIIAIPFGIGTAIYLNEYAKPGRFVRLIEFTTESLSGIPSIIFGLFGYVFFGITLQLGYSIISGSLTLAIMILPLISRNTQEALKTVPINYRSGALGIGATKWYMIRTIVLPSAMPGIITGIILSIGRIVGESAALLFTAGSGYLLPNPGVYGEGLIKKILQSGGTLTIQLYLNMEKAKYNEAFGIALLLLIIVFIINLLTKILSKRLYVER